MVRIALSVYMAVVMAAGPGLCCCTPRYLAATLADSRLMEKQRTCCCHQQPSADSRPKATPTPSQRTPGCPDSPSCPCKQTTSESLDAVREAEQQHTVLLRSVTFGEPVVTTVAHLAALPLAGADGLRNREGASLPFLSAHDLRSALHILRC